MRFLLLFFFGSIYSFFPVLGQDDSQFATVTVLVTDYENNLKRGEQILFKGSKTGKVYRGISDENGKFEIQLPAGDTYLIKIKSIGKAKDYNKLSIPQLKEGEVFTLSQLTIKFEQPKVFTLDNVHFESGKSTIKKGSYEELNELVEFLELKGEVIIEISGHTDHVGEKQDNLKLSKMRADAVKSYLISKGIVSNRVVAKGYGEDQPVDTNNTAEGRQNNRRTEVRILKE
jgi:OmpA-OmpF porin, OOP family